MEWLHDQDGGAYAFFQHLSKQVVWQLPLLRRWIFLGSYWFVTGIVLVGAFLMLRSGRKRAAIVTTVGFLACVVLTITLDLATQRQRPADAQNSLGADAMVGSFPARAVLLSTFGWLVLAMALESRIHRRRELISVYFLAAFMIVLVCMIQLLLSLHFLTDVLAGLAGGGGLALLARHFATAHRTDVGEPGA